MTEPVAVVMAAFNAERFIGEALESVATQTVPPSTVVVVDDGSTDTTAAIAERFAPLVQVLRRPHAGSAPSRNLAIASTDAPLVALLDADDLWLPTKLERQHEALRDEPDLSAVFCLVDEFLDAGVSAGSGVRAPKLGQPAPLTSAALVRREVFELLGPFGEAPVGDWVEWWGRARAMGVAEHVVPEVLIRRRIHDANNSVRRGDGGHTFLRIAREHLREVRRRSQEPEAT